MDLTIVAALADTYVIGNQGLIPWKISEDLVRFKKLTLNHPVIMGRKTYESIISQLHKPLPMRTNIIISSSLEPSEDILVVKSLEDALKEANKKDEIAFVIGGERVYKEAMPYANKMELTWVHLPIKGDTYFPNFDEKEWKIVKHKKGESSDVYEFISYERIKQPREI